MWIFFKTGMQHLVIYMPINNVTLMLQERCAGADTVAFVARILHRSRTNLQSLLLKSNTTVVEDFFVHLVCFLFSHFLSIELRKCKKNYTCAIYVDLWFSAMSEQDQNSYL